VALEALTNQDIRAFEVVSCSETEDGPPSSLAIGVRLLDGSTHIGVLPPDTLAGLLGDILSFAKEVGDRYVLPLIPVLLQHMDGLGEKVDD